MAAQIIFLTKFQGNSPATKRFVKIDYWVSTNVSSPSELWFISCVIKSVSLLLGCSFRTLGYHLFEWKLRELKKKEYILFFIGCSKEEKKIIHIYVDLSWKKRKKGRNIIFNLTWYNIDLRRQDGDKESMITWNLISGCSRVWINLVIGELGIVVSCKGEMVLRLEGWSMGRLGNMRLAIMWVK